MTQLLALDSSVTNMTPFDKENLPDGIKYYKWAYKVVTDIFSNTLNESSSLLKKDIKHLEDNNVIKYEKISTSYNVDEYDDISAIPPNKITRVKLKIRNISKGKPVIHDEFGE